MVAKPTVQNPNDSTLLENIVPEDILKNLLTAPRLKFTKVTKNNIELQCSVIMQQMMASRKVRQWNY